MQMMTSFLIIDDSAAERHLLRSLLQDMGHDVDVCETAEGALDKIANGNYKAVFLDVVMPDLDGYKFLRKIRSTPETSDQYVIFSSTKRTKIEMDYGIKRAGADDYLPKPVSREKLLEALEKVK